MDGLFRRFEPDLGELEDEYRRRYLPDDRVQALLFVLVVVLASAIFIPIDIPLLKGQPALLTLTLLLRGTIIFSSIGFAVVLQQVSRPLTYDRLVFGYCVLIAIAQGISASTRPANYYGTSTFDIVLVLYYYLVVPNRLAYRIMSALAVSAVSMASLFATREPSVLYWTAIPIALLGVHVIGISSSVRSFNYRRREYRAAHETRLLNQRLTVLAETDSLTGVLNRRKLIELGGEEFSRFQRYGHAFSLILTDVDLFKRINDRHGHPAGDAVLAAVASTLAAGRRTNDAVGRLGGEEFAVLLPETGRDAALVVAERLRQQVEALRIPLPAGGEPLGVTFSAGVVESAPGDSSFDDALRRADQLLYRAKERGRNRIEA